ncbi:MAG: UDP-N-acetylglucosamine 2-epimerase (hydrolyzing) [Sandaracinaceae bacterium]|nr:UDP-N-acetylglucosamine 2-epimerase (hydrolyzing) [Sandaracinaceae bacterium]
MSRAASTWPRCLLNCAAKTTKDKRRRVVFLTGTRADFGKLKPLMRLVEDHDDLDCHVFVTGMHTLRIYGETWQEVRNCGFKNFHVMHNQYVGEPMESILANTVQGLARYVAEVQPELLVVHGDRVEALAGALVGTLAHVKVAHIEGGERSGTVDETIRHAVSKLSHLHFVANEDAARRVRQLGEVPEHIFVIGSPDIDVMHSPDLPSLESVRERYEIHYPEYGILLFHPVTTELRDIGEYTQALVNAVIASEKPFVAIYPNNDAGTEFILSAYRRLESCANVRVFPSIRFESFLTLLKNASLMIGNSSAGVREAPIYGVPAVDIGTRQNERYDGPGVTHVGYGEQEILAAIQQQFGARTAGIDSRFGHGDSAAKFLQVLSENDIFSVPQQKLFQDLKFGEPN